MRPLLALCLLGMMLVGCSGGETSGAPSASAVRASTLPTSRATFPPDDITALLLAAAGGTNPAGSDLDAKWRAVFSRLEIQGEAAYEPPDAVLGYRAGDIPDTTCARGSNADRWRNNAFYCPDDTRIVFDEDWLRAIAADVGPEATLAILAHEWGHHVQQLLGVQTNDLREELQADCYAGMYLVASDLVPHGSLDDEDAALHASMTTFFQLGNTDYRASEWFAAQEHGSPVQRILATSTGLQSHQRIDTSVPGGMEKGLPWCFGYSEYEVGDITAVGPYRFVEFPGRTSTRAEGALAIGAEQGTGQAGSNVVMQWLPELPHPGGATAENLEAFWATEAWAGIEATILPGTIAAGLDHGTGIQAAYQYIAADGSNPQTGIFGLVSPADAAGGLLVLAYQPRLASTDAEALAIFEEALVTIQQVMGRLCSPDESSAGANLDPVCMDVQ